MSGLRAHLLARIAQDGPLPLSDYMSECLLNPRFGYYTTHNPLGAAGDFITAPEISQMFGELVGLSLAQAWLDQGAPSAIALAEAGPGRGTLMADALRATQAVPGFHDALSLHLIEASPALRRVQQDTLSAWSVTWHDAVATLPDLPLFLIANEFFDALPIHQFQRDGEGWRERQVGVADGVFAFGLSGPVMPRVLSHRLEDTKPGDIVELCPAASAITDIIGTRIQRHGGAALIIDYGDWRSVGDTFQAVRHHRAVDPLDNPGTVDLTAHVDFEALARATPSAHSRVTPQGVFLERLGITRRAQVLATGMADDTRKNHIAAHRRLTHPQEMGTLFKVMGLYPNGTLPPPGLEP